MENRNWLTRTSNPTLNQNTFSGLPRVTGADGSMTLQGTVNKSFLLLVVLLLAAFWPWSQSLAGGDPGAVAGAIMIGLIGGLVLGLVISFKAALAPYLSIPYAACEGLAMGGISAELERRYPGIAVQAVALTFGVLATMLLGYTSGIIRVTQRFRAIVVGATGAIMLVYLASFVLSWFHVSVPFLQGSSTLAIGVSLFIVCIAALNLALSFDMIASGVAQRAPRYMEWYGAFGLLVTLVWLYMEILRLLSQLRQR